MISFVAIYTFMWEEYMYGSNFNRLIWKYVFWFETACIVFMKALIKQKCWENSVSLVKDRFRNLYADG